MNEREKCCDPHPAEPFCQSLAWTWLALGSPQRCEVRATAYPCRCGHGRHEHDTAEACGCAGRRYGQHEHDGGCLDPECPCSRWRAPELPVEVYVSEQAACSDFCTCGARHPEGAVYYVSADRWGRVARLLGPFSSHSYALSLVGEARVIAERVDRSTCFRDTAFGTMAVTAGVAWPGMLMDEWLKGEAK